MTTTYEQQDKGASRVYWVGAIPYVVTQLQRSTWQFIWIAVGAKVYRIVLDGVLIDTITASSYVLTLPKFEDTPPPIEIVPDDQLALSEKNISRLTLQWYGVTGAVYYQIRRKVGGNLLPITGVKANGSWLYTFITPLQDDESFAEFQITAVDEYEQESAPLIFHHPVVRCPDEVFPQIDYNQSTQQLTIGG